LAVVMAHRLLAILASGLAVLRVSPPLVIEDTRLGLVSPVPTPPFSPSDGKLRSISDMGEVTMGRPQLPPSLASSMSISPVDGSSMMEGLVSLRLKLLVSCLRLLAAPAAVAAVRPELADTERLKEELRDSVTEDWVVTELLDCWRFFISERLFFSSPRLDLTSGVERAARLWPLKALKQKKRLS